MPPHVLVVATRSLVQMASRSVGAMHLPVVTSMVSCARVGLLVRPVQTSSPATSGGAASPATPVSLALPSLPVASLPPPSLADAAASAASMSSPLSLHEARPRLVTRQSAAASVFIEYLL